MIEYDEVTKAQFGIIKVVIVCGTVFLVSAVAGCTTYNIYGAHKVSEIIAQGTNPQEASCAIWGSSGDNSKVTCAILASKSDNH